IVRSGSDEEFLRKVSSQKLKRTDSEATNDSQKSHTSSHSCEPTVNDFDEIEPHLKKLLPGQCASAALHHKHLGDIGKTRSAGDLLKKNKTLVKTFQQLNIMKLPSVDSELADSNRCRKGSFTGVDFFQSIVCGGDDSDSDS
ncbi:CRE-ELL-1 protein, partial [Aphelenchoides avenae]